MVAALGLAGTLAFSLTGGAPASAKDSQYLALGDSVVYGFITHDGPAYVNPDNFLAYPAVVGQAEDLTVSNAACPGEATGGFQSTGGNDNGCRPFKAAFPLHVPYKGAATQEAYALNFLQLHEHHTKLVTIGIGANDLFLLQSSCHNDPTCIGLGLGATLFGVASNMNAILGAIRATGYDGVLMIVNYYSLDYTDASGTAITTALNNAITSSAAAHHAVVADVFTAFHTAAAGAGGHTCLAGLLNGAPSGPAPCDVHPSLTGQKLIAETVRRAFETAEH